MNIYSASEIKDMPVIDSHTHLSPADTERDLLRAAAGQYLGQDLRSSGMPESVYAQLMNADLPTAERWRAISPWWALVRNTGYGRCAELSLKYGLGCEELDEDGLEEAQYKYETLTGDPLWQDSFLRDTCGVKTAVVDHTPARWNYGAMYCQSYNTVHMFTPYKQAIFRMFEEGSGVKIRSFSTWLEACEGFLRLKAERQAVKILKFPLAYQMPLSFPMATYADAESEFNEAFEARIRFREAVSAGYVFEGRRHFQRYMMHFILRFAEEHGMTAQFHTGYLAGNAGYLPDSDPSGLIPLIYQYPGVRFDLFHMGYPYEHVLGAICKAYPNAYLNLCWAHILSPAAVRVELAEWLELLPLNKLIGFGSDCNNGLMVLGHVLMAKANIAYALNRAADTGVIDPSQRSDIAGRLLYGNAQAAYGLTPLPM